MNFALSAPILVVVSRCAQFVLHHMHVNLFGRNGRLGLNQGILFLPGVVS